MKVFEAVEAAVGNPPINEKVFEIILKKPGPTDVLQQKSNFNGNKKSKERSGIFTPSVKTPAMSS